MKGYSYRWDVGFNFRVNPTVVGREIERLQNELGRQPKTEEILEAARAEESVLHELCEWNDFTAAEAHRRGQIRHALNHLVIVRTDGTVQQAFVSVVSMDVEADESVRGYMTIAGALKNPEMRHRIVQEAWNGLESWRMRYEALKEFADVFDLMDKKKGQKPSGKK